MSIVTKTTEASGRHKIVLAISSLATSPIEMNERS